MIREIIQEAKSFQKVIDIILDKEEYAYLELKDGEFAKVDAIDGETAYAYDQKDRPYDIAISDIKRVVTNKKEIDDLESSGIVM